MPSNDRTGVGSGRSDYETPPELRRRLRDLFRPTYDPAASHKNTMALLYSTPDGTFRLREYEQVRSVSDADGLAYPWAQERVVFNPPYASDESACGVNCTKKRCEARGWHAERPIPGIQSFVRKAAEERNNADLIVGILPDARDTEWWRRWVAPCAIDFPIGRVAFINPETREPASAPPGGTCIVMWLPDWLNRRA